jgi:hypothetical protein
LAVARCLALAFALTFAKSSGTSLRLTRLRGSFQLFDFKLHVFQIGHFAFAGFLV